MSRPSITDQIFSPPEAAAAPGPLSCGQCRHWHALPPPPGPVDMAAPAIGRCREQLHAIGLPTATVRGTLLEVRAVYPAVPVDYPACRRFVRALA